MYTSGLGTGYSSIFTPCVTDSTVTTEYAPGTFTGTQPEYYETLFINHTWTATLADGSLGTFTITGNYTPQTFAKIDFLVPELELYSS